MFIPADIIKAKALELGFDLAGIAPADPSQYGQYIRQWLTEGRQGSMDYLARRLEERLDPAAYLPGAKSLICLAISHYSPLQPIPKDRLSGRIARYALGDDYHEILKSKLHQLSDWLRGQFPDCQTKACVDTAPVLEKELAARAGLGWMGKNTCLINPQAGSWLLLGEIITTLELPSDNPGADRCGSCRKCIDACPTGAITSPYQLDARRCISYLTIENRQAIPDDLAGNLSGWLYGCDKCQEVCPWNKEPLPTRERALAPRWPTGSIPLEQVLAWTDEDYRRELKDSPLKRVKLPVLKSTALRLQKP